MEIAEAIVFYHVLVTRAVILDNFAKGLQCLNVLPEIRKNAVQFEKVFLHTEDGINGTAVILRISFQSEDPVTLKLKCFLNNASLEGTCTDYSRAIQNWVPPSLVGIAFLFFIWPFRNASETTTENPH